MPHKKFSTTPTPTAIDLQDLLLFFDINETVAGNRIKRVTLENLVKVISLLPYETTMIGNETFTHTGTAERKFFLDPNGANRNFDPSGTFPKGFEATVINVGGSFNIIFDSGVSAQTLTPGSMGRFIYDGVKWW